MSRKKWWLVFLVSVLWLPTVVGLVRPGWFFMYDDMQVMRVQQMDKCVADGQWPCRWVPDLGYGYGYPLYEYYGPLPYYVMEGFHLLGLSFIDSVKVGFGLGMWLSGLVFILWARQFFSPLSAAGAATLFVFLPFRAGSVFVRGAVGEVWGMVGLLLVLLTVEHVFREKSWRAAVGLAISILVWLTAHNLTVVLGIPVVAGWVILRWWQVGGGWRLAGRFLGGVGMGIGLAGFFVVPLVFERDLVHLETMTSGYFNYLAHFLSLRQLFLSLTWGWGPSVLGDGDEAFLGVGPIHLILAVAGVLAVVVRRRKDSLMAVWWWLVFWGASFLAHQRSSWLWEKVSVFPILQFPWRWVVVAGISASFISGWIFEVFSERWRVWAVVALGGVLIGVYGGFFSAKEWYAISDEEKLSGELWERQTTASIYDYLPKSAKRAPDAPAPLGLVVEKGEVQVEKMQKGSNWFVFEVTVGEGGAEVAVPAYDFPVWKVWVDGEERRVSRTGELGLVGFELSEGRHKIEARLVRSWPRIAGDLLSVVGGLSVLAVWRVKREGGR